jgi:hypothetical protein
VRRAEAEVRDCARGLRGRAHRCRRIPVVHPVSRERETRRRRRSPRDRDRRVACGSGLDTGVPASSGK